MKLLTLGEASKMTGKSKPTISKAIKDGKISANKVDGVFQIEVSELLRVYPAKADTSPVEISDTVSPQQDEIAKLKMQYLEEQLEATKQQLQEIKSERDQALKDAREDRTRFMALLEHQKPRSLWSKITGK